MKKKEKKRIKKALLAIVESGLAENCDRINAAALLLDKFGKCEDLGEITINDRDLAQKIKASL